MTIHNYKECPRFSDCLRGRDGTCKGCNLYNAYLAGLAEGKKEVTYMKAEEYDEYLDACRKNIELEKENAKLKEENKQIVERERVVPEHYLIEMIEKNKELKAHCKAVDEVNEKMKCCGNCRHEHCHGVCVSPEKCVDMNKWELAE